LRPRFGESVCAETPTIAIIAGNAARRSGKRRIVKLHEQSARRRWRARAVSTRHATLSSSARCRPLPRRNF